MSDGISTRTLKNISIYSAHSFHLKYLYYVVFIHVMRSVVFTCIGVLLNVYIIDTVEYIYIHI